MSEILLVSLLSLAFLIVASLALYAGRLLFLLKRQNQQEKGNRLRREAHIRQSIRTIALAVEQQQCDLSEASIRLCVLMENLSDREDYAALYPALHELYSRVSHMPTHDAWKALSKADRRRMEMERQEHETELESRILKETHLLKQRV
ncbi:DUF2489 domain-containing protein [Bowmanella dokdonensis]|uniref:DUF2489 domain-containing protein n=1 Tax=Bowmanella dokdonensis TaxID=751969 RepID=A0A939DQ53_9ALTE|nr:DUF2489 domain-containing protein [Bowmanella dokdonensis]MBN7825881.1 DUF2489 domain-containing protein [Bowmanella dokdonensis]